MMNHGLWTGDVDLDAYQRMAPQGDGYLVDDHSERIGLGLAFPMCGMNVSFRTEVAPYVWQPVLPDGMRRYDDIWSGIVFKRVADLAGWNVTSGTPLVFHERASDLTKSLRQEMLGFGIHEMLWRLVQVNGERGEPARENFKEIWYAIGQKWPQLAATAVHALHWLGIWERGGLR
jgi:hypothetical protein